MGARTALGVVGFLIGAAMCNALQALLAMLIHNSLLSQASLPWTYFTAYMVSGAAICATLVLACVVFLGTSLNFMAKVMPLLFILGWGAVILLRA